MLKFFLSALMIFTALALPTVSLADELTAQEIVKRSDDLIRGNTCRGTYSMTITTPGWQRELTLAAYSTGRERMFIRILSPAKEAGTGTLRVKNEMWNYLPSVEKTIKIPPSMMMQPWMGSDFANDDLVKESDIVRDYTHSIIDEAMFNGHPVAKILLLPKPDAGVIWGSIIRWIRKDDFVPLKEEYYSERGQLVKTLEFSDIEPVSDRVIPRTWRMTSAVKEKHSTVIRLIDVQYDLPVDDGIFTLTNLTRTR